MSMYYNLSQETQVQPGQDQFEQDMLSSGGASAMPVVDAGPEYLVMGVNRDLELQVITVEIRQLNSW